MRWKKELKSKRPRSPISLNRCGWALKLVWQDYLLHSEQGYGDTIQFCRYVPLVAARGARVILQVPRPLSGLMSTLAGAPQILPGANPYPVSPFILHCSACRWRSVET